MGKCAFTMPGAFYGKVCILHAWLFTFVITESKFAVNYHHFIYFHK